MGPGCFFGPIETVPYHRGESNICPVSNHNITDLFRRLTLTGNPHLGTGKGPYCIPSSSPTVCHLKPSITRLQIKSGITKCLWPYIDSFYRQHGCIQYANDQRHLHKYIGEQYNLVNSITDKFECLKSAWKSNEIAGMTFLLSLN